MNRLPPEDIGLLTQPVEPAAWFARRPARFRFITQLEEEELLVAHCNPGDRYAVSQLVETLKEAGLRA